MYPWKKINVNVFKNSKYSYYDKKRKPLIDYNDFINTYPIINIDCSK